MKKVPVVIDISDLNLGDEEKNITPTDLFGNVVNQVILSYSKQINGLNKTERNQFYEIGEKIDLAIKEKSEVIELEDNTCGFLRKCFREAKLNPNNLLKKVEKIIDNIQGYK
jgi:hypothetical protein